MLRPPSVLFRSESSVAMTGCGFLLAADLSPFDGLAAEPERAGAQVGEMRSKKVVSESKEICFREQRKLFQRAKKVVSERAKKAVSERAKKAVAESKESCCREERKLLQKRKALF